MFDFKRVNFLFFFVFFGVFFCFFGFFCKERFDLFDLFFGQGDFFFLKIVGHIVSQGFDVKGGDGSIVTLYGGEFVYDEGDVMNGDV